MNCVYGHYRDCKCFGELTEADAKVVEVDGRATGAFAVSDKVLHDLSHGFARHVGWMLLLIKKCGFAKCNALRQTLYFSGADGGGRTHTLSRVLDFESSASANSATSATSKTKIQCHN